MPLAPGLKAQADAVMTDYIAQMATLQPAYFNAMVDGSPRGKYWQGVSLVDTIPVGGVNENTNPGRKPTDQAESWTDLGVTVAPAIPVDVTVTYYNGPSGQGYTVNGVLKQGVNTYHRVDNFGPETHRGHDWQEGAP